MFENNQIFSIILKNTHFNICDKKQFSNDTTTLEADQPDLDEKLDNDLASLKKNGGEESNDKDSPNNNDDNNSLSDTTSDDTNDSAEINNDESGGDKSPTDMDSDIQQDDSSSSLDDENDGDSNKKTTPRKYIIYKEYSNLYDVLNKSISTIEKKAVYNSNIKNCIAQLRTISDDTKFILSEFYKRSDEDLLLQYQITKKRVSLVLKLLEQELENNK